MAPPGVVEVVDRCAAVETGGRRWCALFTSSAAVRRKPWAGVRRSAISRETSNRLFQRASRSERWWLGQTM